MPDSSQAPCTTPRSGRTFPPPRAEHPFSGVDGRDLQLRIWVTRAAEECPTALASGARSQLPAMLLLDGQWLSDTIGNTLPLMANTPMLVASLGFNTDERSLTAPWRARDYTPASPDARQCDPRNLEWPCGGADTLLALLGQKVLPWLQRHHHADLQRTALFGHSYAGLFSTYVWLRAPTLFSHIYAASPSLWWYWPHALDLIAQDANAQTAASLADATSACMSAVANPAKPDAGADRPGCIRTDGTTQNQTASTNTPPLHLLVGADERWRPQPAKPGMPRPEGISTIPFAEQFLQALRARHPQADARLDILPGLAHGPMLHASATRCMVAFGALHRRG